MEKNAPGVFHNDYAFPAMDRYTRGSFSDLRLECLVEFLR